MATEITRERRPVPSRRLWFGLLTTAVAWVSLGIVDIVIEWRTCMRYGQTAVPAGHVAARAWAFGIALFLLLTAIAAGVTSYRNWRRLSEENSLMQSLATDRREFLAFIGIFVSVTLGMGIFWLSLPPLIITVCQRAK